MVSAEQFAIVCTDQAFIDHLLGSVKPIVDSTFDFDDVYKAYERIMTTRATGKVVVKVDPTVD
jgi:NADPH:quinone reductase-like Zn-dependent oxidoreductase